MVVPCYNKESYIGAMLDSVLAQDWNNIELLLINDGSTDGTRQVIVSYLPQFQKRGYTVKLIDQENGGCCKAVHTGLVNMTGDYFCLVDADDEIEPAYVSTMAGWLEDHHDYEWAACSFVAVSKMDNKCIQSSKSQKPLPQDTDHLLIHYIFRKVITMSWIYMIRVSYIHKCKMIEHFYTGRSKTYEPLITVPLAALGGKLKFFDRALYKYNKYASDLYGFDSLEKAKTYYNDYLKMYEWSINRLNIPDNLKTRYLNMARLSYQLELFNQLPEIGRTLYQTLSDELICLIQDMFADNGDLSVAAIIKSGYEALFDSIEYGFIQYKRIIAFGVLGNRAKDALPKLQTTPYRPTELWDKNGDGANIKLPDFDSLTADDLLIVIPTKKTVLMEIRSQLDNTPATVWYNEDIYNILDCEPYPTPAFPKIADLVRLKK